VEDIEVDDKKIERDMYAAIRCFRGSSHHYEYENWENHLEDFFSYFSLASEQKCRYTQMKLIGETYW